MDFGGPWLSSLTAWLLAGQYACSRTQCDYTSTVGHLQECLTEPMMCLYRGGTVSGFVSQCIVNENKNASWELFCLSQPPNGLQEACLFCENILACVMSAELWLQQCLKRIFKA